MGAVGLVAAGAAVAALAGGYRIALALLAVLLGGVGLMLMPLWGQLAAREQELGAQIDRLRRGQSRLRIQWQQRTRAIVQELSEQEQRVSDLVRQARNEVFRGQREQGAQTEALLQLYRRVDPVAPMPPAGGWALNPTELLELWYVLERRRPRLALELGSGTSSIWIGYALQRHGGRLVSVDHDPDYAQRTRTQLRRHGLTETVELRHAPLVPVTVGDATYQWYDPEQFGDLTEVELLVVDGPPGGTGERARYPALPLLADRLAAGATVILDDLDRADEQEIARRWGAEWGLRRESGTGGRLAVFRYPGEERPPTIDAGH